MSADNRQQEFQMDIMVEGFPLEMNHRDDKDLVRVSQRYAESISGTKSKKQGQTVYIFFTKEGSHGTAV